MTEKISRRDFFKITGLGAVATAVLTGCGPDSRYVTRKPYNNMPEYNHTGISTYYASTCGQCAAGCGVVVRTMEGRALKVDGNANHPVNQGRICMRGVTSVQDLYNPDRLRGPSKILVRGKTDRSVIDWDAGIKAVQNALTTNAPNEIAFLIGETPDHLNDFLVELTRAIGAPPPVRYGALGMLDGRNTLIQATQALFGEVRLPFFDMAAADVTFSFGANFLETWLSPLTYSRAYGQMRQGTPGKRGYLVSFEPRQSLVSANADEWIPIVPGSEPILAMVLARLIAEITGARLPATYQSVDVAAFAEASDLPEIKLHQLAELFARAEKPLAIPGSSAMNGMGGLAAAEAILGLNILVGNLGKPGGLYLVPEEITTEDFSAVKQLIQQMQAGSIKALFVQGIDPVFELPGALGFKNALMNVPTVFSFSPYLNDTALYSDYLLPDHSPLESFGYQRMLAGTDRPTYSGFQPVVSPLYETRATVDVLLAAASAAGGNLATMKYTDEVDFIQQKIVPLINAGGFYTAPEILTFWSQFLQYGGWWTKDTQLQKPKDTALLDQSPSELSISQPISQNQFHLVVYPTQFGDGHCANWPSIQETPHPMTTAMWDTWIEINPSTASLLGIKDDDIVKVTSPAGEIEAIVYLYPAVRLDTVAMPFGQGHEALGRYAKGRGSNPGLVLEIKPNDAGNPAISATMVTITPTGKRKVLARYESRIGVYGEQKG